MLFRLRPMYHCRCILEPADLLKRGAMASVILYGLENANRMRRTMSKRAHQLREAAWQNLDFLLSANAIHMASWADEYSTPSGSAHALVYDQRTAPSVPQLHPNLAWLAGFHAREDLPGGILARNSVLETGQVRGGLHHTSSTTSPCLRCAHPASLSLSVCVCICVCVRVHVCVCAGTFVSVSACVLIRAYFFLHNLT